MYCLVSELVSLKNSELQSSFYWECRRVEARNQERDSILPARCWQVWGKKCKYFYHANISASISTWSALGKEEMPKQASVSNAVCLLMSPGARFAKNDFVKRLRRSCETVTLGTDAKHDRGCSTNLTCYARQHPLSTENFEVITVLISPLNKQLLEIDPILNLYRRTVVHNWNKTMKIVAHSTWNLA